MKAERLEIKYSFTNPESDLEKLGRMIQSKGGILWTKKGRRVYFSSNSDLEVANCVYAQPLSCYLDIESRELVIEVCDIAFNSIKNRNNIDDYKVAYLNTLKG